jgi:hypothetical protein
MNGTEANPQGTGGSGEAPAPRHEIPAYLYVLTIVLFIPLIALVTAGFGTRRWDLWAVGPVWTAATLAGAEVGRDDAASHLLAGAGGG